MPRVSAARIKLGHSSNQLFRTLAILILLIFALLVFALQNQKVLLFNGQRFNLEVADSKLKRAEGLSGRQYLAQDGAMLFVFEQTGSHCMWMKNMNFPLDIVWLSEHKQIIDLKENVSPDSYPQTFCPAKPAKYVIEINAGQVVSAGFQIGSTLQF